jgi:hypothetical protein
MQEQKHHLPRFLNQLLLHIKSPNIVYVNSLNVYVRKNLLKFFFFLKKYYIIMIIEVTYEE